ncbi:hypothetical protein V1512DRAFT_256376 [Lipomyces arxii]|uniref:uncharacterized protein n=1 Tax=Lipomyces arxii TaxID=56418 RepID=UPI0034CFE2F4
MTEDPASNLSDTACILILALEPDFTVLYASPSIQYISGYTEQDLEGKSPFLIVHQEDIPRISKELLVHTLADGATVQIFYRLITQNGKTIECESTITVVYDMIVATIGAYQETTKSKERARTAPLVSLAFQKHSTISASLDQDSAHELRVALILNRSSFSLPVMFASSQIAAMLNITPDEIKLTSLWDCMTEPSLEPTQLAFERAKDNEAVSYVTFTWQDPRSHLPDAFTKAVEAVICCSSDGILLIMRVLNSDEVSTAASSSSFTNFIALPPPVPFPSTQLHSGMDTSESEHNDSGSSSSK